MIHFIKMDDLRLEAAPFAAGGGGRIYKGRYNGIAIAAKQVFTQMVDPDSSSSAAAPMTQLVTPSPRDAVRRLLATLGKGEFLDELRILSELHHPNVVTFYGVACDAPKREAFLVEELCDVRFYAYTQSSLGGINPS